MTPQEWIAYAKANDWLVVRFAPRQALPPGWHVIQLDSGHYMGVHEDDIRETAITVNRFDARRWCFDIEYKDLVNKPSSTGTELA